MTLEQRIRSCRESYYNGVSEISDAEFDRLCDELRKTDPRNPALTDVGAAPKGAFPKARHVIPMGSQNKAVSPAELQDWAERTAAASYTAQYKLDGASLELQYEKGKLIRAVTRGDGVTGSDITANARRMTGVIPETAAAFTGGIRGEVLMTRAVWAEKYSGKRNRRDTANGIMLRKSGNGCEDLVFIAYDTGIAGNDGFFTSEAEKIAWLKHQGFTAVAGGEFSTIREVITYKEKTGKELESLPVDIDGIVVKAGRVDMADLRRNYPERQIAFKFRTAPQGAAARW
jgi:DNA ligase (NAD+)